MFFEHYGSLNETARNSGTDINFLMQHSVHHLVFATGLHSTEHLSSSHSYEKYGKPPTQRRKSYHHDEAASGRRVIQEQT